MRRRRQHTKRRSELLETCRRLDCSPTTTRQSRRSKQDWTRQGRPVTNPCPSARGFGQARIPTIECRRLSRALWPLSSSLEQHRAKVVNIERSLQERRNHLEQLHRQPAAEASHGAEATQLQILSQMESPSTCPRRQRTASRKLQTSMRKNAKRRQQQERQPHVRRKRRCSLTSSAPDPTAEARIQASVDELLQAQTRGDPERLAVLRAQMARDLSSPVPKKRPKQG